MKAAPGRLGRRATSRRPTLRSGLTLIELLVVVAVVGILVALLLPAVIKARGAARKAACSSNLKQLGGAVQQFHHRHGSMPTYFGSMNGNGGAMYGGWLLHLLPDLGEQSLYDALPVASGTSIPRMRQVRGAMIRPAQPASADYYPGDWVEEQVTITEQVQVGTKTVINHVGVAIEQPVYETRTRTVSQGRLVNVRGTPATDAVYEYRWEQVGGSSNDPVGIPPDFGQKQSAASLAVLQCGDDPSSKGPGSAARIQGPSGGFDNWSLTNYLASAHALVKFGGFTATNDLKRGPGGRMISGLALNGWAYVPVPWSQYQEHHSGMGGRFMRGVGTRRTFTTHDVFRSDQAANGLSPRKFDHLLDGTTNTILFGEGMRQCDNEGSFRIAFLPVGNAGNEHTFGIDPTILDSAGAITTQFEFGGYGNTLMFQVRPGRAGCNKFRLQSNHEDALMVAMADGSVRAISSSVSRREQNDPDVAGRTYGANTYNATGLGGKQGYVDGVWDMLLMPTDGSDGQVLTNTGEIGKEK